MKKTKIKNVWSTARQPHSQVLIMLITSGCKKVHLTILRLVIIIIITMRTFSTRQYTIEWQALHNGTLYRSVCSILHPKLFDARINGIAMSQIRK